MILSVSLLLGIVPFLLSLQVSALLEEAIVSFSQGNSSSLEITRANIIYSQDDPLGIRIAAESLVRDLEQITGTERRLLTVNQVTANASSPSSPSIIVGSVDSELIQRLAEEGLFDTDQLEDKWESFATAIVDNPLPQIDRALVIVGSDKRGTIFGIHTLAEQSGQSPYHYFADVPTKKHDHIYALPKATLHGEPSVRYRGLFINDEAPVLDGWWGHFDGESRRPLDAEFYAHVFDLLLRLKANMLWPAMWASFVPPPGNVFFTDDPKNQQLADDYGIVVSTSHHEPMQRASNEWNKTERGPWDWAKNSGNVTDFMDEGVARAGTNESYYTIGMRGLGDEALSGTDEAVEILTEIFEVQRDIIKKYHGSETAVPQVWALYKEVIAYYEAGLDPPDDVTLLFPDDNFGNVVRLPIGDELERGGGCGVYFHLEYVGAPRSYKWANTNNLAKLYKDMYHSYIRGATQIWMVNVGDIKPMEVPFSFMMDMAWNADKIDFDTIPLYLERYAAREFGDELARDVGEMLLEFSHLVGLRKYEHIHPGTFSTVNYHEAERVLRRWQALDARAKAVYEHVDDEYKPAFYQLVYFPIVSGALYMSIQIDIGTNYRFAQERRNIANTLAYKIIDDFDKSLDLVEAWDAMLDGKWEHMMDQAVYDANPQGPKWWAGPARDMLTNVSFVQLRQNMPPSAGNVGIYAEGSDSALQQARWVESIEPTMPTGMEGGFPALLSVTDRYTAQPRHFDLFARGDYRVPTNWTLDDVPVDWLTIKPSAGVLDQNTMVERLNVTIDWDSVPEGFNDTVKIGIRAAPATYPYFDLLRIPILNVKTPADFTGFPAAGGIVSIEATHFQRSNTGGNGTSSDVEFTKIPGLGTRSESGSISLRPFTAARANKDVARSASVEYDIHLFNDTQAATATVYINMCLETDPDAPMHYSLTVDAAPANMTRLMGEYITDPHSGNIPPQWMEKVMDQVWTRTIELGPLEAGTHTLRWAVDSPEVYLEKIVLDTGGFVKPSYFGPPETTLISADSRE